MWKKEACFPSCSHPLWEVHSYTGICVCVCGRGGGSVYLENPANTLLTIYLGCGEKHACTRDSVTLQVPGMGLILFHQWVYLFRLSIVAYMFTAGWDWDFVVFPSHTQHSFSTMSIGHQGWRLQVRTRLMSPCSMIHIFSVFCNEIFSSRSGEWPGALPIALSIIDLSIRPHLIKTQKEVAYFWHWEFLMIVLGM